MRKLRIFFVELILVGILVAWIFERFPQSVDKFIRWIVLAILWHLTWEIWDAGYLKSKAERAYKKWGQRRMTVLCVFCIGGLISLGYWYSVRYGLTFATKKPPISFEPQQKEKASEAKSIISEAAQSNEQQVPQIQLSVDILPFVIDIPTGEDRLILIADNPDLSWTKVHNPKSNTFFWPSYNVAKNNRDMMCAYTVANLGKVNVYNLRAQLEVEFTAVKTNVTSKRVILLDIGFLFPGRPVTFYFVNRSMSSNAALYPPENAKILVEGESQPREVPFTRLVRDP